MIEKRYILKKLNKIKRNLQKSYSKENYEDALCHICLCARLLYITNIYYLDKDLEKAVSNIADRLHTNNYSSVTDYASNDDVLLFYDGLGLNDHGLAQIYLEALCKVKKVVYVTFEDRIELIPDIMVILDKYGCDKRYINRSGSSYINQINQLNSIIKEFRPKHMFVHTVPYDVVAIPVLYSYEGFFTRYQINITDHAFWLGVGCIDKCLEFREYGARLSYSYRDIPKSNIIVIPFYPILHREKSFQGFPFEMRPEQKVVFSGGSLYKTQGGDGKYYKMVAHILTQNINAVFWYAGSGDDRQMQTLMQKFPGRVYLTPERPDLLQILEHCRVYLSTYPLCGGLMYQYAATAGCVPVTLKNGDITDGFLINQKNINVEFENLDMLYAEVDRLINDDGYAHLRSKEMKESVMLREVFEEEVARLVTGNISNRLQNNFDYINTDDIRNWYLKSQNKFDVCEAFLSRIDMKTIIIHYPLEFLLGGVREVFRKII